MRARSNEALVQMRDVLLETYAVNDAMNQLLLVHIDPASLECADARSPAQWLPNHRCDLRAPSQ